MRIVLFISRSIKQKTVFHCFENNWLFERWTVASNSNLPCRGSYEMCGLKVSNTVEWLVDEYNRLPFTPQLFNRGLVPSAPGYAISMQLLGVYGSIKHQTFTTTELAVQLKIVQKRKMTIVSEDNFTYFKPALILKTYIQYGCWCAV